MGYDPLEYLAECYGNVVIRDRDGNPGVFVRFDKCRSSDLDPSLPNHTHPAFIINGKEQDSILIGKYKGAEVKAGGAIYSAPNAMPAIRMTYDAALERMRAAAPGITSGMTIADYGLILLLAKKNGWAPKGNTNYGQDLQDGTCWVSGQSVSVGAEVVFRGWKYTARKAHTTSLSLMPEEASDYWMKGDQVGGTSIPMIVTDTRGSGPTYTGTGPNSWYLDGEPGSLCDFSGNVMEFCYGYRTVDMELQILENNDAASPFADMSENSGAWRAILPDGNGGHTLVTPGTEGTLKWNLTGNVITLDTTANLSAGWKSTSWNNFASNVESVPAIVKELGLFPTGNGSIDGSVTLDFAAGEAFPRMGSYYSDTVSTTGIARQYACFRTTNNIALGCRPRALRQAKRAEIEMG